jgi:hypothetical protein|tara:strand:+ start:42 stop:362 length:321 start_codon:yes stop_codon:yes gene_type:complete
MKGGFTIMFDLQGYERGIRNLTNEERRYVAIEVLLQCFDYRVSRDVTVRGAHNLSEEDYQLARQEIEGQMETFDRIFSGEYTGSCWNEGLTRWYRDDNNDNNGEQS